MSSYPSPDFAGIHLPTLAVAVLLLVVAKIGFFRNPAWKAYYFVRAAGFFSLGWATPFPLGAILIGYSLVSAASGWRAWHHAAVDVE